MPNLKKDDLDKLGEEDAHKIECTILKSTMWETSGRMMCIVGKKMKDIKMWGIL